MCLCFLLLWVHMCVQKILLCCSANGNAPPFNQFCLSLTCNLIPFTIVGVDFLPSTLNPISLSDLIVNNVIITPLHLGISMENNIDFDRECISQHENDKWDIK